MAAVDDNVRHSYVTVVTSSGERVTPKPLRFTGPFGPANVRKELTEPGKIQFHFKLTLDNTILSQDSIIPNEPEVTLEKIDLELQTLTLITNTHCPDRGVTFYGYFDQISKHELMGLYDNLEEYMKFIKQAKGHVSLYDLFLDEDNNGEDILNAIAKHITKLEYGSLTAIPHRTLDWKWKVIAEQSTDGLFRSKDLRKMSLFELLSEIFCELCGDTIRSQKSHTFLGYELKMFSKS